MSQYHSILHKGWKQLWSQRGIKTPGFSSLQILPLANKDQRWTYNLTVFVPNEDQRHEKAQGKKGKKTRGPAADQSLDRTTKKSQEATPVCAVQAEIN